MESPLSSSRLSSTGIPPCAEDRSISSFVFGGRATCRSKQWKYAITMVLHKKKDRAECGNYRGISLGSARRQDTAAGDHRPPQQVVLRSRGDLARGTKKSGFRSKRSTIDMVFVIHPLQEWGRKKQIPLYVCFIDLTKAYDFVDRTLLWTVVLARFGVPQNMISVIRQFHGGMQACVRLDDRVCSGWFAVEQGLRRGYVLAPLMFNIFFAAVINVACTRFKAGKDIMDA